MAGSSSACVGGSLGLKRSLVTQVVMEKSRFIKAEFIRLSFGFWLLVFKSACKILYRHLLKLDLISLKSIHFVWEILYVHHSRVPLQLWRLVYFQLQPGFICRNYLSLGIDQAVLRRSVGCKTYMGVLSLQGWRGESDRVNISEHDTKKTDCGTSATHPDTHKTIVTRE